MIRFTIITLFPEFFSGPMSAGQVGRGLEDQLIAIDLVQLRDFASDKYGTVDDKTYGGGPGMVLQCDPLVRALEFVEAQATGREAETGIVEELKVIALSPAGKQWSQELIESEAARFSETATRVIHYVLICGRYEGLDQRFVDYYCDQEISIGPYVLNGGEAAAWIILESLCRFVPGIVGKEESTRTDSFGVEAASGERLLDWTHYTTPADFRGLQVPEVLRSGHHAAIQKWRQEIARKRTRIRTQMCQSVDNEASSTYK